MEAQRQQWLDYYNNHYLKSAAELYANDPNIPLAFTSLLFQKSKNVDNQRERKKMLKTAYHYWDKTPFLEDPSLLVNALTKDNVSSSILSHYIDPANFDDYSKALETFRKFNKFSENGFKITRKNFDIEQYLQNISEKLNYPAYFDQITNCYDGFKLEPVENLNEVYNLSKKYHNCWQATMQTLIDHHNFFLVNVNDKNDELIGTLRYLTVYDVQNDKNKQVLSAWVNPELVDNERYFEFSEDLLRDISEAIYNSAPEQAFHPDNIDYQLHYNNSQKTISDLSPWNVDKKQIHSFIQEKENKLETSEDNTVKKRRRLKM